MKRLHRMILGVYIGPLLITFLIVLFLFSMQWLWKWVDDLMGKGLPWDVLAKLIAFATSAFVPAVLPLAVLLSSIMTMGGLGERSELTPMRSAGLGLFRIMAPLMVFVLGLAGFSFYFSNNVLPVANLKFQSLLWDVTRTKPALNLQPGVFFGGLDGFSIRVGEKDDRTGALRDVLIYDHRQPFQTNKTVVRAEKGTMSRSTDGRYLVLTLENGRIYDERGDSPARIGGSLPLLRGRFQREEIRIDLSGMGMKRTDEDLFKDHYKMLTLGQLGYAEDSLALRLRMRMDEQEQHLRSSVLVMRDSTRVAAVAGLDHPPASSGDGSPEVKQQAPWFPIATDKARNAINLLDRMMDDRKDRATQIAKFQVEWHRKLMLAFACVVFFFIGAPLGAIVRKGGMGVPAVIAIVFFLIFHILSYSTEQMVRSGALPAWPGMWISTFVLLPIGVFLTWKAATDSPLFDRDAYDRIWNGFSSLFKPRHAHPPTVQ
ncbi:MAG: LptF/LptG family permease [Flavobacteriales bacterium]|jgi:lipopolysaccharide export system permease protein|nr:LptF/LptG family permease [Flavobacteriales bacterium]